MAKLILNADGTKQDKVILPPSKDGKWVVEKGRITDCPFCAARFVKRQDRRETKKEKIKWMRDKLTELGIEV